METNFCPAIIDVEASGFGSLSYPIEVGVINTKGERYCALISPDDDWQYWSELAEQVHGISRLMLMSQGRNPKQICQELNIFLGTEHVFSDAWTHDKPWIEKLFATAKMVPTFSLRAIEYIMSEDQFYAWDETKSSVREQLDLVRHRASSDAYIIQQTFVQSQQTSGDGKVANA